jgi:hypothetical protein
MTNQRIQHMFGKYEPYCVLLGTTGEEQDDNQNEDDHGESSTPT